MNQNTQNSLSFQETYNRIESIEKHLVDLLSTIPTNTELYLELNNSHSSLIKSRQLLKNSGDLAPLFPGPVKGEGNQ